MVDGYQQKADTGIAACHTYDILQVIGLWNAEGIYNDEISQRHF